MTLLNDIVNMLDALTPEELRELKMQVDELLEAGVESVRGATPEERIRQLEAAAAAIREGVSDEEWAQIERDMNDEYIEPWDESEWLD